jgi:hypothetical protein
MSSPEVRVSGLVSPYEHTQVFNRHGERELSTRAVFDNGDGTALIVEAIFNPNEEDRIRFPYREGDFVSGLDLPTHSFFYRSITRSTGEVPQDLSFQEGITKINED